MSEDMRGQEWCRDDLEALGCLVRDAVPMREMRERLGRSTNAIQHAIRNMLIHQLFDHDPAELAAAYGFDTTEDLRAMIVPAKFDVPPPPKLIPGYTRYASENGKEEPAGREAASNGPPNGILFGLALFVAAGASNFVLQLFRNFMDLRELK